MSLSNEEKNAAYEKLTPQRKQLVDKVMENLEKGNLFWTQGWVSSGAPESAITGKKYRGINNLFLSLIAMSENYGDNRLGRFCQDRKRKSHKLFSNQKLSVLTSSRISRFILSSRVSLLSLLK